MRRAGEHIGCSVEGGNTKILLPTKKKTKKRDHLMAHKKPIKKRKGWKVEKKGEADWKSGKRGIKVKRGGAEW